MSETFTKRNYSILTSLNDDKTIYIKITDTVNFICYEENIQQSELRKDITLKNHYELIQKCFASETGFAVYICVTDRCLQLKFHAMVGGFLQIDFVLFIKEKILSNDGQLTAKINRQDMALQTVLVQCQTLATEIKKLQDIIDRIEICTSPPAHWTDKSYVAPRISSTELTLADNQTGGVIYRNVASFYQLRKLIIRPFTSMHNLTTIGCIPTIVEMELDCAGNGTFNSLDGIVGFSQLQTLTVINSPNLTNVVNSFKKQKQKLPTSLKFVNCPKVNVVEMQTYCLENKITIAFS